MTEVLELRKEAFHHGALRGHLPARRPGRVAGVGDPRRVSARLVGAGRLSPHDVESAGAQLAGAVGVALLATAPVVLLLEPAELECVGLLLAGFIAVVGYVVARGGGATRARSLLYATSVLVLAVVIAELKNRLAGH
jgi:hypothetical protein